MIPPVIYFGPVQLHLYGLMIGIAVIVGAQIAVKVGKSHGTPEKVMGEALVWVLIGGFIGARLYHVIDLRQYYLLQPAQIMAVWRGGLGILGGVIGGLVALCIYVKYKQKETFLRLVDAGVFGLLTGQIIGRLGNWINQELYGLPTTLPWGIQINLKSQISNFKNLRYHPLFAYEMLLNSGLLLIMLWLERRNKLPWGRGAYLAVYLIGYGLIRFILEYLRIEPWRWGVLTTAQWISVLMIGLGSGWLGRIARKSI